MYTFEQESLLLLTELKLGKGMGGGGLYFQGDLKSTSNHYLTTFTFFIVHSLSMHNITKENAVLILFHQNCITETT